MELAALILLAFFVFLAILLFKLIHKVVSFVVTLLLLACIFAGALAYVDYRALEKGDFQSLLIFTNDGKITYAAEIKGFDLNSTQELPKAERIRMEMLLNSSDYDSMLGENNQKLIIVSEEGYGEDYTEIAPSFKAETIRQMVLGLRQGKIIVYPESLFFRVIKKAPAFVVSKLS